MNSAAHITDILPMHFINLLMQVSKYLEMIVFLCFTEN